MKGVRVSAKSWKATEILNNKMSKKLGISERLMLKVKQVSKDPAVWDFIPKNSQLKKAWDRMSFADLRDTFLMKLLEGEPLRIKMLEDFSVEVLND